MRPRDGLIAALIAATGALAPASAGARTLPVVKPAQELALLLTPHKVFSGLQPRRSTRTTVQASRPITGGQTALPVTGHRTTADGLRWLRVMLPGRPNGSQGWIDERGTDQAATSWHIVVTTSSRRVRAYHDGRVARSFAAIVGKPSTPTPKGQFFVEESIRLSPGSSGAPFALATSARSNVLQEFAGGPGQIGIHGVANLRGRLGSAVSHGCVRLGDRSIRWLAARIRPGTPVTITP
jgi:lipoprotein-anchoring transpeptidase ErfK/SrfK